MSLNLAIISGRIGSDLEPKETTSGTTILNFSVATESSSKGQDGEWKKNTEWHKVVCFNHNAKNAAKYLSKGSLVTVEGKLSTRKWTDKDGVDRYNTEIIANNLTFDPKKNEENDVPF